MQIMLNSFSFATCVDAQQIVIELTFDGWWLFFYYIVKAGQMYRVFYVFLIFVIFLVRDAES